MTPGPLSSAGDSRKPILILGLGNPLRGDDGVGCRVVEALARQALPTDVEALDGGTPGLGLLHLIQGRRRAIIVDAVEMGRPPGSIARFRPEEVCLAGSSERCSLHHSGVAEALVLGRVLNLPLPELVVFGVQPARVGWGEGLSPRVQAAVGRVVEAVSQEAGREPVTGADHGTRKDPDH